MAPIRWSLFGLIYNRSLVKEFRMFDKSLGPVDQERQALANVDLNLLVALEAVLALQNVSWAARSIGTTQPAMSRSLSQLRQLFGDQLLIRASGGMKLTCRGEHIKKQLGTVMGQVREALRLHPVSNETRLCVDETLAPTLLPPLLQEIEGASQHVRVKTFRSPHVAVEQLRAGTIEFMVGAIHEDEDTRHLLLEWQQFVTLRSSLQCEKQNPLGSLHSYLGLKQACPIDDNREIYPQVTEALLVAGLRHSSLVEVPDVLSAALLCAEDELLLTVPSSVAGWLTDILPLTPLRPPIPIENHSAGITWQAQELPPEKAQVRDKIAVTMRAVARPPWDARLDFKMTNAGR